MAEPITVKKKKLTIKSKTVKKAAPADAGGEGAAADAGDHPGPFAAQAATAAAAPIVKQPSYMLFAILALLTTLMFIGIIVVQWTEWSYLKSAFPRPIQAGPVVPS
ncbi:MAG: hypothetical protein HN341_18010 [Verrucomicrobia bacterium]|jgi:hypothetical protein|nr:hypothetical protein [Verrucomicrobiota bacterium]